MFFILFSFLSWLYLIWYSYNHLIIGIDYGERGGGGGSSTEVVSHVYYYYRIKFPHSSIDPSQTITFYDALGNTIYVLPSYYQYMNYGEGVLSIPGGEQNTVVEGISTATYFVLYSSSNLIVDYERAEFKISKNMIKFPTESDVKGTFQYLSVITPFKDVASIIDGRWDTQVQTEFFAEPPSGYNYAILDLGSNKTIQAMDIVAGFYKPDDIRKFDVDFNMTLQYSTDGTNYYNISDKTHNIKFTGGESLSLEEEELGAGFTARYLKLILENVKKIDYGSVVDSNGLVLREGVYVVALTEISVYDNIAIKSTATLVPTTELTEDISLSGLSSGSYPSTINVLDTSTFSDTGTAYIWNGLDDYDAFTYSGKGTTFFWGVSGLSNDHSNSDMVVQTIESDSTVYDYDYMRQKLGDRIYKVNKVSDETLFTQAQLDYIAKRYLLEFVKNHSKAQVDVMFSPHIEVGQTIQIIDSVNNVNDRYFVESFTMQNDACSLVVAKYP